MTKTYQEANCSAMVQIVARALCQLHGSDPDRIVPGEIGTYEGVAGAVMAVKRVVGTKITEPHPLWLHFVADAKTAIEALRESNEEMLRCITSIMGKFYADQPVTKNDISGVWRGMIDIALAEKS